MLHRGFIFFSFVIIFPFFISCATSQTTTNTGSTSGTARIYAGRSAQAKIIAIDNALHRLVMLKLEGSPIAAEYQSLRPFIDIRSTKMVHNWKVLREKEENDHYYVQIRGVVSLEEVSKAMDKYRMEYRPVFLLLIDEMRDGKPIDQKNHISYSAITRALSETGAQLIDYSDAASRIDNSEDLFNSSKSDSVATLNRKAFVDQAGIDILLIGSVAISDQSQTLDNYDTTMKSKRALINLRAVDVYTGNILASISDNAAGVHVDQLVASQNAIVNCLKKKEFLGTPKDKGAFLSRIETQYISSLANRYLSIIVPEKVYSAEFIQHMLSCSARINSVEIAEEKEGSVVLSAVYAGPSTDLQQIFNNSSCGFSEIVSVTSVTSDTIVLSSK